MDVPVLSPIKLKRIVAGSLREIMSGLSLVAVFPATIECEIAVEFKLEDRTPPASFAEFAVIVLCEMLMAS